MRAKRKRRVVRHRTAVPFDQLPASIVLTPSTLMSQLGLPIRLKTVVRNAQGLWLTAAIVTFASTSPTVATVGVTTGTIVALTNGTTTILATSGGITSEACLVTVTGTGALEAFSDVEPTYNVGTHILVLGESMDDYGTATQMGATLGVSKKLVPVPSPAFDGGVVNTAAVSVIAPGRGESGQALRLSYPGAAQNSANFASVNTEGELDAITQYFSYYARINLTGAIDSPKYAVKWFQIWHQDDTVRLQWATHDHLPWTGGSTSRTYWQVFDTVETPSQATQPVGPYFADVADGEWHRFTYSYRPNSSVGARDGYAQMWIDGTQIIKIHATAVDVTPPGGEKVWCTLEDIDGLSTSGIRRVRFGSTHTTNTSAWSFDVDDFLWWHA